MSFSFELTAAEEELVSDLAEALARAIEQHCPRLVVQAVDLELRPAPHHRATLSAA